MSCMTRSPACLLDVVREHYRHVAGSLILGKTSREAKGSDETEPLNKPKYNGV